MSLAPWRGSIASALHRNRSLVYSRYLQLATIHPSGRPANRTVVFRGFLLNTDQLQFTTDARSEKAQNLGDRNSWAEACWYFPNTREQFRISGTLTLVGDNHSQAELQQARSKIWQEMSDGARSQFAWPHPGKPRVENRAAFEPIPPDPKQPLANFCLLLLDPVQVDSLNLRGEPQNRYIYRRNDENFWSREAVNP